MGRPRLTKLELQILEALWQKGACSIREIQETFPEPNRPAYTTVQTVVYRLAGKKALRCVKRISNANIFESVVLARMPSAAWWMNCSGCSAAGPSGCWHT